MKLIRSIEITNFRSIVKTRIDTSDLNIIVGQNDIGKSNFLKALNLFFNNETEVGTPFRFQEDFAKHARVSKKKAPQISIKIEFNTPSHFKDNEALVWTKYWREDGFYKQEMFTKSGNEPTARSKGPQWVRKIKYKYVPAIRGAEYFNSLMGDLHDVLSEIDPGAFLAVSNQFTTGLASQVDQLLSSIDQRLGFQSQIGMPSNFKLLFSTLDFSVNHDGISVSLNKKGDGIKAQHIPIILKFIAEHYKSKSGQSVISPETIWGFEEPENNMELGNAFKLSKIFAFFCQDLQVFINTHSPAFYSLAKDWPDNAKLFVAKSDNGTQLADMPVNETETLDIEMGFLPIISEYVRREVDKQNILVQKIGELSKLNAKTKFLILSEDKDLSFIKSLVLTQGYENHLCEFVSYESRSNLLAAIQSCRIKLTDKPNLTDIIFHRDRDVYDGDEPDGPLVAERIQKLNDSGKIRHHLFVTDGYDAESYFLNPSHIHELYPDIPPETIEKFIDEATLETEEKSMNKLYERIKIMAAEHEKAGKNKRDFSYHKVFKELNNLYKSNMERYRYGKTVYGRLIGKLNKGRGKINLLRHTTQIEIPQLQDILNKASSDA